MEPRLHQRLQDHLDDRLRHAVGNGRNAERPRAAVVLRYLDEPHGRRMIRARRHPIPDLVQVTLQVLLEPRQGHPIHARSTAVRLHPLVRLPDELLGNVIRLCLRHRLLPSRVGQSLWRECRVPSLRPHYQASSLLRTRPSLRPASVLGSSRFRRLEVSLGIEAPGSHVPHKSLSLVSRRLHAGRRSASQQAPSELHPRPTTGAWFWRRPYAFDTSSTVQSHSSYQRTPDGFSPPFPQRSPPPAIVPGQLAVVWTPILQSGPEGPALISCAARLLRVWPCYIRASSLRRRGARSSASIGRANPVQTKRQPSTNQPAASPPRDAAESRRSSNCCSAATARRSPSLSPPPAGCRTRRGPRSPGCASAATPSGLIGPTRREDRFIGSRRPRGATIAGRRTFRRRRFAKRRIRPSAPRIWARGVRRRIPCFLSPSLRVKPRDPAKSTTLALRASYAICEKVCLPAEARLTLTLSDASSRCATTGAMGDRLHRRWPCTRVDRKSVFRWHRWLGPAIRSAPIRGW